MTRESEETESKNARPLLPAEVTSEIARNPQNKLHRCPLHWIVQSAVILILQRTRTDFRRLMSRSLGIYVRIEVRHKGKFGIARSMIGKAHERHIIHTTAKDRADRLWQGALVHSRARSGMAANTVD